LSACSGAVVAIGMLSSLSVAQVSVRARSDSTYYATAPGNETRDDSIFRKHVARTLRSAQEPAIFGDHYRPGHDSYRMLMIGPYGSPTILRLERRHSDWLLVRKLPDSQTLDRADSHSSWRVDSALIRTDLATPVIEATRGLASRRSPVWPCFNPNVNDAAHSIIEARTDSGYLVDRCGQRDSADPVAVVTAIRAFLSLSERTFGPGGRPAR
ncbi:MAG: hypothetical protein MUE41_16030, partial [Gemmatimonadaceae bacterium]|nr:hypothetical protein [Gemmatimonadaceae bacterium]